MRQTEAVDKRATKASQRMQQKVGYGPKQNRSSGVIGVPSASSIRAKH